MLTIHHHQIHGNSIMAMINSCCTKMFWGSICFCLKVWYHQPPWSMVDNGSCDMWSIPMLQQTHVTLHVCAILCSYTVSWYRIYNSSVFTYIHIFTYVCIQQIAENRNIMTIYNDTIQLYLISRFTRYTTHNVWKIAHAIPAISNGVQTQYIYKYGIKTKTILMDPL